MSAELVEYVCTASNFPHHTTTPAGYRPLKACPAWVHGKPCKGKLNRIGKGSRGPYKKGSVK